MGWLTYGSAPPIEIEDRLLHHLQAVIITKLRRDEPFAFNWEQARQGADGEAGARSHGTIWISRASQLYFHYDGPRTSEPLNRNWLEQLTLSSNSTRGLDPLPEPEGLTNKGGAPGS